METKEQISGQEPQKYSNKRCTRLFIILTILFFLVSCVLTYQLIQVKNNLKTETAAKEEVVADNQDLIVKLEKIKAEYEELSDENENVKELFDKEKKRVERLLREIKNLKGSAADYKNKVANLEKHLKDYQAQIEELKARNQEITAENLKLKTNLDSTTTVSTTLTSENKGLSEKVAKGSLLTAYEVVADGIRLKSNGTEIPTEKVKRVKKIRTSFLLSENAIAEKGKKTIYIRIAKPDGEILSQGKDDANMFTYNGERIVYSLKQDIDYQNKSMDLCYYWDKTNDLAPGDYNVAIFVDDYQVGEATFYLE